MQIGSGIATSFFRVIPSAMSHGWLIADGQLDINWMSLPPAPRAVLEVDPALVENEEA